MERVAWSDERLDDLSGRVDAGFERIDRDLRDLRAELRSEVGSLRRELHLEVGGLRSTMIRVGGGIMVGLVGVIAAVFANGA
jgi:hypothetical protein